MRDTYTATVNGRLVTVEAYSFLDRFDGKYFCLPAILWSGRLLVQHNGGSFDTSAEALADARRVLEQLGFERENDGTHK